ncbi:MAG: hypothetical protein ABI876_01855 [Bacteroidota bacterium]
MQSKFFRRIFSILPLIIVAMILSGAPVLAQESKSIFVSPGVSLAYTFGDHGGFTIGGEVSVTTLPSNAAYFLGGLINIDYCFGSRRTKAHVGFEGGGAIFGLDVGPSWVSGGGRNTMGITISPFLGLVFYPYYSATLMFEGENIHQAGVWGKWPIPIVNNINLF